MTTQPSSSSAAAHQDLSSSAQLPASSSSQLQASEPSISSRNDLRRSSVQTEQSFYSASDYPRRKQPRVALHPGHQPASFSFVCLGTGGGPLEGDCSCYLLKAADQEWQDGSIVVEGGSWLGALTDVLEQHGPDSAFYDFEFPPTTPSAYLRAGLMASFSSAFLISHAHLDHILGLVLGSASLPGKRSVFGLKPTLENILDMFNGKIWPKLASWKEDEPHTMYHMRCLDNQRPFSVSDSLSVLPFALSHGLNPSEPPAPPTPTYAPAQLNSNYFSKRMSLPVSTQLGSFQLSRGIDDRMRTLESISQGSEANAFRRPSFNNSPFFPSTATSKASNASLGPTDIPTNKQGEPVSPRASPAATAADGLASASSSTASLSSVAMLPTASGGPGIPTHPPQQPSSFNKPLPDSPAKNRRPRTAQGSERRPSPPSAWTPPTSSSGPASNTTRQPPRRVSIDRPPPSLDSTAFFITHKNHDRDVLFFGDVEPDCVSQSPRNRQVWSHAAERFAEGRLNAIFLECSFAKGHPTEFLYGHLSVEHLFDELRVLAQMVKRVREMRRRGSNGSVRSAGGPTGAGSSGGNKYHLAPSPLGTAAVSVHDEQPQPPSGSVYDRDSELRGQLQGLGVIVIHVKPALFPTFVNAATTDSTDDDATPIVNPEPILDHRTAPQKILDELEQEEQAAALGVRFVMAEKGMRIEC
ncbi:Cyclic-AMP phosphodiesterase, class-II [Kalmanozyma brasiliensis GHG001]|uniref:3',5'-cyclic-nucleotide phosphodiesterase n=1 Tax=Kalmanozyma brasiliensis (strain GHG001) TaxID=1365824 RepID=V5GQZ7_KALBG|nr:Cyclic-AMP phosphodiesterase, class-II [Kalmanozyma brasiliensis GHG001]EST08367.1 Cyclic-AMP phosphodiesterase, class-II [Kalmanozyma brasiliensis GHG001]